MKRKLLYNTTTLGSVRDLLTASRQKTIKDLFQERRARERLHKWASDKKARSHQDQEERSGGERGV